MAEEYHRSALTAHRSQGRIDVPLPVFEPTIVMAAGVTPNHWRWRTPHDV